MRKNNAIRGPQLTIDVIDRIKQKMRERGFSARDLMEKMKSLDVGTALHVRTIQNWCGRRGKSRADAGNPIATTRQNLKAVADALNVSAEWLRNGEDTSQQPRQKTHLERIEFSSLARIAREIDQELIEITRRLSTEQIQVVRTAYRRVLNDALRERGFDLHEWTRMLQDSGTQETLARSVPKPDLAVEVGSRFDSLVFRMTDGQGIALTNPALLWDCACNTPDSEARPEDCPIHGQPLGEAVNKAFSEGMVEITWRDVATRWRDERDLWPPSVDTFAFLLELERAGVLDGDCTSVLDLGSGTGLLGIALAKINASVTRLVLADWLLTPSLYGALNWTLNHKVRDRVTLEIKVGMFSDWMIQAPSAITNDVVLCNPPYLPLLPGFEQFGVHAVVAGTELLSHVVQHAPLLGRRVFLQFSHLAKNDAQITADAHRAKLVPLSKKARLVPFRVRRAWSEMPGYFGALRSMKDGLVVRSGERHPYWHSIHVYEVKPTSA